MADLILTPANLYLGTGVKTVYAQGGEAFPVASCVYQSSTDNRWYITNATIEATSTIGFALTRCIGVDGQFEVLVDGQFNPGATIAQGTSYVVSATGGIAPESDLVSTNWIYRLGTGRSDGLLDGEILNTKIQKP